VSLSAHDLSTAALNALGGLAGLPVSDFGLPYAPVIDGVEVTDEPHTLAAEGQMHRGPLIVGSARDESCGKTGVPPNMDRPAFLAWANLTYGAMGADPTRLAVIYQGHNASHSGGEWAWAVEELMADFDQHCPTRYAGQLFTARTHAAPVYLYNYAVPGLTWHSPPDCAVHCSENSGMILGGLPNDATPSGLTWDTMAHYFLSFYRTGDPNTERLSGAPTWPLFTNASSDFLSLALPDAGGVAASGSYRQAACDYWETLKGAPYAR
jgi:carboxylesterase type B